MAQRATLILVVGLALLLPVILASSAQARDSVGATGAVAPGGAAVGVALGDQGQVRQSGGTSGQGASTNRQEYALTLACLSAYPGNPLNGAPCEDALVSCPVDQPGPRMWTWAREIEARTGEVVQDWHIVGWTCSPQTPGRPTLTRAHLRSALASVPWAKLSAGMQPPNNLTLVTLPVYYQAQWAADGISPGETIAIDPARMLGFHVDLRPVLIGYTYHFGDGTAFGPTPEPGGSYPNGAIIHPYTKAGTYEVRIDATLSAEFRIDGGTWTRIPDQVNVPGVSTTMQVKTARAVLVQR